ncbi:MAG: ExbD/TolR family protein [Granulosicoccaceae bacterium]
MRFRDQEPEQAELNLTPLIDVVFLLLIFFMVSTTFQKESEIKISLPQAATDKQPLASDKIEVLVNADGSMHVGGLELVNSQLATVRQALQKAANGRRDIPLVIRADKGTPYQAIVTVMDAGSQIGLLRISLPTLRVQE